MAEFNDFVGIPWLKGGYDKSGAECWGLVILTLREVLGVHVKEYNGSKACGAELSCIIDGETNSTRWHQIARPQPGSLAVMYDKKTGRPNHVGVFVGNGNILHSPDDGGRNLSQIHPVRLLNRAFKRIEYYRYDNCAE